MGLSFRVAMPTDLEKVLEFARRRNDQRFSDPNQRRFAEWGAKWRTESLQHYLATGWCFLASRGAANKPESELAGFYLAQPFLFFRSQTQTLWVEELLGSDTDVCCALAEVAVRVAREKHMQRVLFSESFQINEFLLSLKGQTFQDQIIEVMTTKG